MTEQMQKVEERIVENEEKLSSLGQDKVGERMENVEDRLKDIEKETRQGNVSERMEKIEEKIKDTEVRMAAMRKDKESTVVDNGHG